MRHSKSDGRDNLDASAKIKRAVTFLVVDNAFVVKLSGPQSKLVVQIRRCHDKTIALEKRLKQFALAGRSFSECEPFRIVVETVSQLPEIARTDKRPQMAIDRGRLGRKISAAIDSPPTQMLLHFGQRATLHSLTPIWTS